MYCTYCGTKLEEGATVCNLCNHSLDKPQNNSNILDYENNDLGKDYGIFYNKPGNNKKIAMILSLVVPGLGQMYLNQRFKGFLIFVIIIFSSLLTNGIAAAILVPLTVLDALKISSKINKGIEVGHWQWF